MVIVSRQKYLAARHIKMRVQIGDKMNKQVGHTKSLGLTIGDHLSCSKHVNEFFLKISSAIGALEKIYLISLYALLCKSIML